MEGQTAVVNIEGFLETNCISVRYAVAMRIDRL